jgi:hypothetical protein
MSCGGYSLGNWASACTLGPAAPRNARRHRAYSVAFARTRKRSVSGSSARGLAQDKRLAVAQAQSSSPFLTSSPAACVGQAKSHWDAAAFLWSFGWSSILLPTLLSRGLTGESGTSTHRIRPFLLPLEAFPPRSAPLFASTPFTLLPVCGRRTLSIIQML